MKLVRITTIPISLKNLLKGQLKYMQSRGIKVYGVSSPGVDLDEVAVGEGVEVTPIKMSRSIAPLQDLVSLCAMIVYFLKVKPDIVHSHTPKAGMVSMLAAWFCRVPIRMHTVAGLPLMESRGIKKRILVAVEKLTYACATMVYPNSRELMDYINEEHLLKGEKCKMIGNGSSNGIDVTFFSKDKVSVEEVNRIKNDYGLNENVFCFVGRVVRDKGICELVDAMKLVVEKCPDAQLMLVGEYERDLDPLPENVLRYIKNSKNVFVTGWVNDVRPYMLASNYFVFPSYREGFPNVILQAQALELPCVVTNINGCNEIIEHNVNGYIIRKKNIKDLCSYMIKLTDNEGLLMNGLERRNRIKDLYSSLAIWQELYSEYQKLYGLEYEKNN